MYAPAPLPQLSLCTSASGQGLSRGHTPQVLLRSCAPGWHLVSSLHLCYHPAEQTCPSLSPSLQICRMEIVIPRGNEQVDPEYGAQCVAWGRNT